MAKLGARFGITRYEADEFYRIALDFYRKRNLEDALHNIGYALNLLPYNAEYHAAKGFFHLEDGDVEQAAEAFDVALKRHPYEMLANYGKGVIAYRDRDYQGALISFTNAWAMLPDRAETLYYLALTHHRLKDNRKALDWMRQAQMALDKLDDKKRSRDAARWVAELEKQIAKENVLPAGNETTP